MTASLTGGVAACGGLAGAEAALAVDITVTNTADNAAAPAAGSLRQAILDANATPAADRILFASGLSGTIQLAGSTDPSALELYIDEPLTIVGPGAGTLELRGGNVPNFSRHFRIFGAGDVTISGLRLENGISPVNTQGGGSIYSAATDLTVRRVTIQQGGTSGLNSPGGAIRARLVGNDLRIDNSRISNHSTAGNFSVGGAMSAAEVSGNTSAVITDSTITQNGTATADNGQGGGISATTDSLTIRDSTISGNYTLSPDGSGGGIDSSSASTVITDSTISDNSTIGIGASGAGIFLGGGATTAITDSTISENHADNANAGGLWAGPGSLTVRRSTISNNYSERSGGAMRVQAQTLIEDSVVSGNHTTATDSTGTGGALALNLGPTLTLSRSTLSQNRTVGFLAEGGAIFAPYGSHVVANRSTLSGNYADDAAGGAIGGFSANVTLRESTLSGNHAAGFGGGAVEMRAGGGNGKVIVENSTFSSNYTEAGEAGSGGAIRLINADAELQINNSTLTGNEADVQGGAVFFYSFGGANADVDNTIISGNTAVLNPDLYASPAVDLRTSLIGDVGTTTVNDQGGNLLGVNPAFGPLANNGGPTRTHALGASSPAINAGSNGTCEPIDQRGAPRGLGGRCDMGAYERIRCAGALVNRVGTNGADRLNGTSGHDGMLGLGGGDAINALGGDDRVCAGAGADRVFGRAGNDRLLGQAGLDRLFGQAGRDRLLGQAGFDRLFGGAQRDLLFGGGRGDRLFGQRGPDALFGGAGNDRLVGGRGQDLLRPGPGRRDRVRQ